MKNKIMEKIVLELKRDKERLTADKEQFAIAVKTWRLRNRYTQQKAGEMMGVSRYTIMRAEACKDLTWETIYRMFAYMSEALREEGAL